MYTDIDDPEFQRRVTERPEFDELVSEVTPFKGTLEHLLALREEACSRTEFRLQNHQLFLKRFFSPYTPYRSAIFNHETGVGKSCTALVIAEEYLSHPENETNKVLIIASEAVSTNFRREAFNMDRVSRDPPYSSRQCTGNTYLRKIERLRRTALRLWSETDRRAVADLIDQLIDRQYDFLPYLGFSNQILNRQGSMTPDAFAEWVRENYSNRLIIVDEAHNSRPSQNSKEKRVEQALRLITKYARNTSLILMSATTMYNDFTEIIWLLNLCLWNDKRVSFFADRAAYEAGLQASDFFDSEARFISAEAEARFRKLVRSYVSYIRSRDPFKFPFRLDPPVVTAPSALPHKNMYGAAIPEQDRIRTLRLVCSPMGKQQKEAYLGLLKDEDTRLDKALDDLDTIEDLGESSGTSGTSGTSAATGVRGEPVMGLFGKGNVAYPNETFERSFTTRRDESGVRVRYAPGLQRFLSPDHIRDYAPKIAAVVDAVKSGEGVCFVYSNFVANGCLAIALALEEAGFVPYGADGPMLEGVSAARAGTYLLFSGGNKLVPKTRNFDTELGVLRSDRNVDGKLVKVVIGTKVISEGIDMRFIRQVHILEPWFNMSLINQIVGRGIRTCSHNMLPFEKQNCTVYFHALTFFAKEKDKEPKGGKASAAAADRETLDLMAYRISEAKQRKVARVMAVLQSSAFDCHIQYGKNHIDPALLKFKVRQERSEDKALLELPIRDLITAPGDAAGTAAECEQPDPALPDDDAYVPVSFLKDREVEILDALHALFYEAPIWTMDDILRAPRMLVFSKENVETILDDVVTYPHDNVFLDSKGRQGVIEKRGKDTYAFLPYEIRHINGATEFERTHPIPKVKSHVLVGEEEAGKDALRRQLGRSSMPELLEELLASRARLEELLLSMKVPDDIVREVGLAMAFDRFPLQKRYRLGMALLEDNALAPELWTRVLAARTVELSGGGVRGTVTYPMLHPKEGIVYPFVDAGKVVENLHPLGAMKTAIAEMEAAFQSRIVKMATGRAPGELVIGLNEYHPSGSYSKTKLITDIEHGLTGKVCSTFNREDLQALVSKIKLPEAGDVDNKVQACDVLEASLRYWSGRRPHNLVYLYPEQYAILRQLRKADIVRIQRGP